MNWIHKFEDERATSASLIWIILGNVIYAISINTLITPMSLYNGGFMGIAQLIRYFIKSVLEIPLPAGFDIMGVIYFIMNVPLFFYAYKAVGLKFSIKSLISIGLSSLCLILVPIPKIPLFKDYLSACVVGGVIGGVGSGMILRGGSSTGGSDIIGVCMSKTRPNLSVGKVNLFMNAFVYLACFFVFNVQIAVYSFIYTTIRSLSMDRMHSQNINTETMIFTKVDDIDKVIMSELGRGVTKWEGVGAYTDEDVHIMVVAVTKFEVTRLTQLVMELDPKAFMIFNEGEHITGNFKKRLD